ncbi:hypothetical protein LMB49_03750 [Limosilactobacillus reuteri]|uniref:coiled-coil domain-containing protein n=1 Tax=Limosilactobacillus reuteri TaxID=1598 RepID=UPI001E2D76C1|nr:hypothetical protein [Limosilactobacillus reuteri]MCC4370511.1 hypothetical protein [Limosilactobacillus reuteri]MCC4509434.1 hypothetical protein [Limosilactobacillus reuteri]
MFKKRKRQVKKEKRDKQDVKAIRDSAKKKKHLTFFKKKSKAIKQDSQHKDEKHLPEKEVIFPDIKMYRAMPVVFFISVLLIVGGYGLLIKNNHDYKVAQSRISFKKGTNLPLLQGSSEANLTMGNSIVSKDGKDMAVEINYDDTARKTMSTFGYKYKLYLLAAPNYPVDDIELRYGYFSTDGNGVLQIHSKKGPLKNQAFILGLWDRSGMVDSDDLGVNQVTEDDVDNSITNQIATGDASSNSDATVSSSSDSIKKSSEPPVFYLRVNPASAKRVNVNWNGNEQVLIDQLFVNQNMKKLRKQLNQLKDQKKALKANIDEMQARLKKNPDDQTAEQELSTLQSKQDTINQNVARAQKNYDRVKKARFGNNILGKEQTKHKTEVSKNVANYGIN